jgi:hypothetical protein
VVVDRVTWVVEDAEQSLVTGFIVRLWLQPTVTSSVSVWVDPDEDCRERAATKRPRSPLHSMRLTSHTVSIHVLALVVLHDDSHAIVDVKRKST